MNRPGIIPGQDCWIYDAAEDTTFHQTEAFYGHHGFRLDAFTPPYTVCERSIFQVLDGSMVQGYI